MRSNVESEVYDIPVPHLVFLALKAPAPSPASTLFALIFDEVIIPHDFGTDEAFLEIRVDDGGGLGRGSADRHGPGSGFLGTGREEGLQAQEAIRGANDAVQTGF